MDDTPLHYAVENNKKEAVKVLNKEMHVLL